MRPDQRGHDIRDFSPTSPAGPPAPSPPRGPGCRRRNAGCGRRRDRPRSNSRARRRRTRRHGRWRGCPPCRAAAAPPGGRPRRDRRRRPPSRTAADNCGSRTETSCRRSAAPRRCCGVWRRRALSASAVAIGSKRSPSISSMIAACSAGDTVMALPLSPRLNGATIGTLTWPSPRLEAIATGASRCAASNRPILSLSRTFDHDTSRTSVTSSPSAAANPLSTATISAAASTSGMKPMCSGVGHFSNSDAVRIDCAISPIFFFSRIAVERIST